MLVLFKIKLVQTNQNVGPRMFLTGEEVARRRVGEHGVGSLDGRGGVERGPRVGDEIHVGVAVVVGRRVGRRKLRMGIENQSFEYMMDEMRDTGQCYKFSFRILQPLPFKIILSVVRMTLTCC